MKNTNIKKTSLIFLVLAILSFSVGATLYIHPFSQVTGGAADIGSSNINLTGNGTNLFRVINTKSQGLSHAVYGKTTSSTGYSIYAYNLGNGSAVFGETTTGVGVGGHSAATSGSKGIEAYASSSFGNVSGVYATTSSSSGTAVYAHASSTTGTTYGVWGQTTTSYGNGYAGYFTGGKGIYVNPGPNITIHTSTGNLGPHHFCGLYYIYRTSRDNNDCDSTCYVNQLSGNWQLVESAGGDNCLIDCDAVCFDFI